MTQTIKPTFIRLPVSPLAYTEKDKAQIRELIVDYVKGKIYILNDQGVLLDTTSSVEINAGTISVTVGGSVMSLSDAMKEIDKIAATANGAISVTEKGAPNGLSTLGPDGKVKSEQLPSFVDDIIPVSKYIDLPVQGDGTKIYLVSADPVPEKNGSYRWGGSSYVAIENPIAFASIEEAEAGIDDTKAMTAYKVKHVIDNSPKFAELHNSVIATVNNDIIPPINNQISAINTQLGDITTTTAQNMNTINTALNNLSVEKCLITVVYPDGYDISKDNILVEDKTLATTQATILSSNFPGPISIDLKAGHAYVITLQHLTAPTKTVATTEFICTSGATRNITFTNFETQVMTSNITNPLEKQISIIQEELGLLYDTITEQLLTKADLLNGKIKSEQMVSKIVDVPSNKTLTLADDNVTQKCSSSSATSIIIPTNANVAFAIESEIGIWRYGSGTVTISAEAGVTIRSMDSKKSIRGIDGGATLKKSGINEWWLFGSLE